MVTRLECEPRPPTAKGGQLDPGSGDRPSVETRGLIVPEEQAVGVQRKGPGARMQEGWAAAPTLPWTCCAAQTSPRPSLDSVSSPAKREVQVP